MDFPFPAHVEKYIAEQQTGDPAIYRVYLATIANHVKDHALRSMEDITDDEAWLAAIGFIDLVVLEEIRGDSPYPVWDALREAGDEIDEEQREAMFAAMLEMKLHMSVYAVKPKAEDANSPSFDDEVCYLFDWKSDPPTFFSAENKEELDAKIKEIHPNSIQVDPFSSQNSVVESVSVHKDAKTVFELLGYDPTTEARKEIILTDGDEQLVNSMAVVMSDAENFCMNILLNSGEMVTKAGITPDDATGLSGVFMTVMTTTYLNMANLAWVEGFVKGIRNTPSREEFNFDIGDIRKSMIRSLEDRLAILKISQSGGFDFGFMFFSKLNDLGIMERETGKVRFKSVLPFCNEVHEDLATVAIGLFMTLLSAQSALDGGTTPDSIKNSFVPDPQHLEIARQIGLV